MDSLTLKDRWRLFRPNVISGIAYWAVKAINATVRTEFDHIDRLDHSRPAVLCGWHGRTFQFTYYFRNRGCWVIISQSRDGDIQNSIFKKFGYQTIRGSTGRGGARAAVESIRALRKGGIMALSPDGPRGPSHVVQAGCVTMAQKSGALLYAVGVSAKARFIAKSWDSYLVPYPFTKGLMILGEPIEVPADATEEQLESIRLQLEQEITRYETEADRRLGHG